MNINTDFYVNLEHRPNTEKTQIILLNTNSNLMDFLVGIENKVITKIPTYIISKLGVVYNLYDPKTYSNLMDFDSINYISISIALENYGPLLRFTDTGEYFNLRNQVLTEYTDLDIHEVEWRDFRYWDKYTDKQKNSLIQLTNYLCNEHGIKKNFIGHNNKYEYASNFNGIMNRSNYSKIYYDLSPAMDFDWLKNEIEQYEAK